MHKAHIHYNNSGGAFNASVIKAKTFIRWRSADHQLDGFLVHFAEEKGILYSIQDCLSCTGMFYMDLHLHILKTFNILVEVLMTCEHTNSPFENDFAC